MDICPSVICTLVNQINRTSLQIGRCVGCRHRHLVTLRGARFYGLRVKVTSWLGFIHQSKDFGLSVMNTIGTCGLIISGLTRWRITVLVETVPESGKDEWSSVSKHQVQFGYRKWSGWHETGQPNLTWRGKFIFRFSRPEAGLPTVPVDPTSAESTHARASSVERVTC